MSSKKSSAGSAAEKTKPAAAAGSKKKQEKLPTKLSRRNEIIEEKKAFKAAKLAKTVPEVQLRKRRSQQEAKASHDRRVAEKKQQRAEGKSKKKEKFIRAEMFVKEFRVKEKDAIRLKRLAARPMPAKEPESKVLFVLRIKTMRRACPKTQKVLKILRLRNVNTGVFLIANGPTMSMLRMIEPYVTWGVPSPKVISDLIYKRGFTRIEKKRVPITDNQLVAAQLGKDGVVCVEDIVHELTTGGPAFRAVSRFLCPFKLSVPLGGFKALRKTAEKGGDVGDRGDGISELIAAMC